MLDLRVYYHDVLRYTIIANWDKVQELRNKGFYVQVRKVPGQGYDWTDADRIDRFLSIDDEFGVHKLAEVQPDAEYHTLGFY